MKNRARKITSGYELVLSIFYLKSLHWLEQRTY